MDIFRIGKLRLGDHEQLIVGDPCYFADTPNGCYTADLGWTAGDYGIHLATEGGLPLALILTCKDYLFPSGFEWLQQAEPVTYLGVDSGQMAMIAASVLPTWTHNEKVDWNAPACDYDYTCIATLQSQLRANLLGSRLAFVNAEANGDIGMAVASSTRHGDGQYPLVILYERTFEDTPEGRRIPAAVAVLFDWEEDEGEDDWLDEDAESSDMPDADAYYAEHGVEYRKGACCPDCGHVDVGCTCVPDWTRIDPDLFLRAVSSTPRR